MENPIFRISGRVRISVIKEKIAGVARSIEFFWSTKEERKAWDGYLAIFPLGVMRGFESLVITSRQWPLSPMKDVISVVILQIRHVRFLLLNETNSLLGERLLQRIPLIRNPLSPLFFSFFFHIFPTPVFQLAKPINV